MVEGKLGGRKAFAAILAGVSVACEDVSAVELHIVFWKLVVKEQADDSWNGNIEIDSRDPVAGIRLETVPEAADLAPALEIVVAVIALFEVNDLGKLLI